MADDLLCPSDPHETGEEQTLQCRFVCFLRIFNAERESKSVTLCSTFLFPRVHMPLALEWKTVICRGLKRAQRGCWDGTV